MMVLFYGAAQVALVVFDPFLSSRPLADAILHSPDGQLILDRHYYAFSSVAFYTNRPALLLNGRKLNLSYGSYAPGAPDVFIDDAQLKNLWQTPTRYYLVVSDSAIPRLQQLVGQEKLNVVAESGGKFVLTNIPLPKPDAPSAQISVLDNSRENAAQELMRSSSLHHTAPDRTHLDSLRLAFTKPANTRQTRYSCMCTALFTLKNCRKDGSGTDRIVSAMRPICFRIKPS
jgi:hypothetical protein